ncbi:MAG: DUF2804 domain-containing protein [Microthrixaceae bacterium]
MTTNERELRQPVDLCTPDGTGLNPEARGWSRRPLHRANLVGEHGRNKRWDYWAVLAGDTVVSALCSDLDTFALADAWWADLTDGSSGGAGTLAASDDMTIPDRPGTEPIRFRDDVISVSFVDDAVGTHLNASWAEPDGRPGSLEVLVELPEGHESLNVVIPWDDDHFNFTSKHQARPASGTLTVGSDTTVIGGPDNPAWGILDVGRGRWPSPINWNWGGGAGEAVTGQVVGLQFGAKWTAGSGFTENGFLVDGRLTKIGRELDWDYHWDDPMRPWRIVDPDGQIDVVLTPRFDKHTAVGDETLGSETHQVFGTFAGSVRTDDGTTIDFDRLQGFAEEARQRW